MRTFRYRKFQHLPHVTEPENNSSKIKSRSSDLSHDKNQANNDCSSNFNTQIELLFLFISSQKFKLMVHII
jgi:hypothetical protein